MNKQSARFSIPVNERDATIIKRVGLGWGATLLGQLINFGGRIVSIPVFLSMWGPEKYGQWLTLYAFVGYLAIIDFGMQPYVFNRLRNCYSINRLFEYNRILHSALSLSISVALIAMLLFILVIFVTPLKNLLSLKDTGHLLSIIFILLAGQIIFAIPIGLTRSVYSTVGEYPRGMMTDNLQQFIFYGLTIVVLLCGGGLVFIAWIQLLPLLVITLFILYDLKNRHPEIQIGINERDWSLALSFLLPSLFFSIIYLSGLIVLNGSILVVNAIFGAAAVVVFATIRTMCNLIQQFIGIVKTPLWPEITAFDAEKDYAKLRMSHKLLVKLSFAVCGSIVVFLHFFGKDIINIWMGGRIIFDQRLLDLFLVYLTSQIIWSSSSLLLLATNHHRKLSIYQIVSSIIGLAFAIILATHIGLNGIVLGLCIADISICLWFVPRESCNLIGENLKSFWTDCVLRGIPILLFGFLLAWWAREMIENNIVSIAMALFGISISVIVMGYYFWLNSSERMNISSILLKAWKLR